MTGRAIRLLGEPSIIDATGQTQIIRGHQPWALLARVLLARAPLSRRSLAAELFPETVDPLGSLRWCLASLRKALNSPDCLRGDPVEPNIPTDTQIDVLRFSHDDFDIETAGPLLGSQEPHCSPEFATWLLIERERIAGLIDGRIRRDIIRALAIEDHDRAVRLADIGVRRSPLDESAHVLLVKSLALAGRHRTALAHVDATEAVFLAELGEKPTPALRSAARRTVSSPPGGISMQAFVNSLIRSGTAALAAGATESGLDSLRRAVHEAEKLRDKTLLAQALLELGTALVHAVRGFDEEGSVLLRQCAELARSTGNATIGATGFRELGYVEALAGRRPAASDYLAQALNLASDPDALAGIHAVIGFNLVDWGKIDDGLNHYETSLELARRSGNRRREIWALGIGARGLLAADRLADAEAWLRCCLTLVDDQRWIAFRPWPMALLAESHLRQRIATAALRPNLEEAFALSCQLADPCWEAAVARTLALTHAAEDDLAPAMLWLSEARRRCARSTDGYAALQVEILANQVEFSARRGQHEAADTFAREWISMAARTHMDTHVARAAAFIRTLSETPKTAG